jgi:hypothetical protein
MPLMHWSVAPCSFRLCALNRRASTSVQPHGLQDWVVRPAACAPRPTSPFASFFFGMVEADRAGQQGPIDG